MTTADSNTTRWNGDHWEGWNGEEWVRWTGTEWVSPAPRPTPAAPAPGQQPPGQQPPRQQPPRRQPPGQRPFVPQPAYGYPGYGYPGYVTDRSDKSVQAVFAWVFTALTVLYFLPWAIAATRGKSNSGLLGLLTLLLGWTVIGWIVLIVMACQPHQIIAQTGPIASYPGNYGSGGQPPSRY